MRGPAPTHTQTKSEYYSYFSAPIHNDDKERQSASLQDEALFVVAGPRRCSNPVDFANQNNGDAKNCTQQQYQLIVSNPFYALIDRSSSPVTAKW